MAEKILASDQHGAVNTIRKAGDALLKGDVTLTEGSNITITQAGQDLSIASSAGGVTLEDEGSTVTGGPHTTLNFVGEAVAVADAGSGEATVTISTNIFGSTKVDVNTVRCESGDGAVVTGEGFAVTSGGFILDLTASDTANFNTAADRDFTPANNTWYFIHIIGDTAEVETTRLFLSDSSTAPTLPSGYDVFARIGAFRSNFTGGPDVLPFYQEGNDVWAGGNDGNPLGSTVSSTTFSTKGYSTAAPPTSRIVRLEFRAGPTSVIATGGVKQILPFGATVGGRERTVFAFPESASDAANLAIAEVLVMTNSSQQAEMAGTTLSQTGYATRRNGWIDRL